MSKRFARISLFALAGCLCLPRLALAQANNVLNPSSLPEGQNTAEKPVSFAGFTLNYTLSDTSGLNAINYNNSISQLFEPSWAFGRLAFKSKSPFSRLSLDVRFPLDIPVAGYDPSTVAPDSNHGEPQPCSNLTPSANGNINPSLVQRCSYANQYRAMPGDLAVSIANPAIFTIPKLKVKLNPSIRFTFPTSYASQFATMQFAAQGSLGLGRSFFDGKLAIGYAFAAAKYAYRDTSAQVQATGPALTNAPIASGYDASYTTGNDADFFSDPSRLVNAGGLNTSFSFTDSLTVSFNPTDKLSFSALYSLTDAFAYTGTCGVGNYGGVMTDPCANSSSVAQASHPAGVSGTTAGASSAGGRAHSDVQGFFVSASYQIKPWVGISATWITFTPFRMADNSWRQPFFWTDYDSFSSLNVGATFTLGYTN